MTLSASSCFGLLLLATCAAHVEAARVKKQLETDVAEIAQAAEAAGEQATLSAIQKPEQDYWWTMLEKPSYEAVAPALVNHEYIQQFELKEDYRMFQTKRYKAKLDQHEDPDTHVEVRKDIDTKVLELENHFFTMHGMQTAEFHDAHGNSLESYSVYTPHVINRRYTWRVAKSSDPDKVLYTISKRLWDGNCKVLGFFKCKPILKIYEGHRGDKSTLIYYGVGDDDLDEPDFKFYHSEASYKANKKKNWVAKVEHKKHKGNGEDKYKVKVAPGNDAGLLLLAATALDTIGDDAREDEDQHDGYHINNRDD